MTLSNASSSSQGAGLPTSTCPQPDPSRVLLHSSGTRTTPIPNTHWTKYVHVSGSVYFYNTKLRLVTEDDVEFDMHARREVVKVRRGVLNALELDGLLRASMGGEACIPEDAEMIVRLDEGDEEDHVVFFMSHSTLKHIVYRDGSE